MVRNVLQFICRLKKKFLVKFSTQLYEFSRTCTEKAIFGLIQQLLISFWISLIQISAGMLLFSSNTETPVS